MLRNFSSEYVLQRQKRVLKFSPEWLVQVPIDHRRIRAGLNLNIGAGSLELFKEQLQGFHLLRDGGNAFSINGITHFSFCTIQDFLVAVHIFWLEETAGSSDLAGFRAHPHRFGKSIKFLHLCLSWSKVEIIIFIQNGLYVQITIPTKAIVQVSHEVGNARTPE